MTQYELAQMALRSDALRMRIGYLMVKAALAKLAEQSPSAADILLGQRILKRFAMWANSIYLDAPSWQATSLRSMRWRSSPASRARWT